MNHARRGLSRSPLQTRPGGGRFGQMAHWVWGIVAPWFQPNNYLWGFKASGLLLNGFGSVLHSEMTLYMAQQMKKALDDYIA